MTVERRPPVAMPGLQLRASRTQLGLTQAELGELLGLASPTDSVRRLEAPAGRRSARPVRQPVADRVEALLEQMDAAVVALVAEVESTGADTVPVYADDEALHAARPQHAAMPAAWWGLVVLRAVRVLADRRRRVEVVEQ